MKLLNIQIYDLGSFGRGSYSKGKAEYSISNDEYLIVYLVI